jgi:hypothetical protein
MNGVKWYMVKFSHFTFWKTLSSNKSYEHSKLKIKPNILFKKTKLIIIKLLSPHLMTWQFQIKIY